MSTERKGIEVFVGLFLLVGFGVVAGLVVVFGRVGQGMQDYYPLRVRFPNASGLVRGSDVLLSGARIGVVAEAPKLAGEHYEVEVELGVRGAVKVPRTATFQVRSNGMLGDSYVDVVPPANFTPSDLAQPGELIVGSHTGGLDELTSQGSKMIETINSEVLKKLSDELDEIKTMTVSINQKLLSDTNLKNLEESFANLRAATADFAKVSHGLDAVVAKADQAMDAAKGTMKTIDGAAGDIRLTLGDFRKVSTSAQTLLNKATNGDGALGTLISDKQTAENLKAWLSNTRRSGVLFYKDRPVPPPAGGPAEAPPTPKRR